MPFFKSSLFNLNKPMGPCLVQALYCVALVLIALGLARGVVQGVRLMSAPPPAIMAQATPPRADLPAPPPPVVGGERRPQGFGPGRRFRGPPRPGFMMGGMLRGMPPAVLGIARILGALFVALVMAMIVRVLAEIANAILAMGAKARN